MKTTPATDEDIDSALDLELKTASMITPVRWIAFHYGPEDLPVVYDLRDSLDVEKMFGDLLFEGVITHSSEERAVDGYTTQFLSPTNWKLGVMSTIQGPFGFVGAIQLRK